jgi:NhaA family Na+:H+ antiporter
MTRPSSRHRQAAAAAGTWVLVHESGVHATVAGVLFGFTVPVTRRAAGPSPGLAEHLEHRRLAVH